MSKTISKVLAVVSALVMLYAVAAMVATFTQLANAADRVYLGSGQPVFWLLVAVFAALVVYPVVLLLRLPKAMRPPETDAPEDFADYQKWLALHLAQHPQAEVKALAASGDISGALQPLGSQANSLIRSTASNVFVSTALIQNGRLDGLIVLATQLRLVWQIGMLYNLRPSPRQLWYLYSNVGGTMLVASNLEDLDFAEIAGPIVNSVAPSLAAAVPGLQGIGNLLVNSIANGSANAFLTLRVGLIAKSYCAPVTRLDRQAVRKSATLAALSMLTAITQDKGAQVAKGVWSGITGTMGKAAGSAVDGAKKAATATGAFSRDAARSVAGVVQIAGSKTAHAIESTASVFSRKEKNANRENGNL